MGRTHKGNACIPGKRKYKGYKTVVSKSDIVCSHIELHQLELLLQSSYHTSESHHLGCFKSSPGLAFLVDPINWSSRAAASAAILVKRYYRTNDKIDTIYIIMMLHVHVLNAYVVSVF